MDFKKAISYWSSDNILEQINKETTPVVKNRQSSSTIINTCKEFMEETKFYELCKSDLNLLNYLTITHLHILTEEELANLQKIYVACHNYPYTSLKDVLCKITTSSQFKELKTNNQVLVRKYMRAPNDIQVIYEQKHKENVENRNEKQIRWDYLEVLKVVNQWGMSNDVFDNWLCVLACVGCRKTSVVCPSIQFVKAINHCPYTWIRQVGVLKSRDTKMVEKPLAFGYTFAEISNLIQRVRKFTTFTNLKETSNKYQSNLVKRLRASCPNLEDKGGVHLLRSVYANTCYKMLDSKKCDTSLTNFIKKTLCHENLETSLAYQNIHIEMPVENSFDVQKELLENKKSLSFLRNELQQLKSKLQEDAKKEDNENLDFVERCYIRRRVLHKDDITINNVKIPFNHRGKGRIDMSNTIALLNDAGIEVTKPVLQALGYGSVKVNSYFTNVLNKNAF